MHEYCDIYNEGSFKTSIVNVLRGIVKTTKNSIEDWRYLRGDWGKVKGILNKKEMIFLYSKLEDILQTFYYSVEQDIANSVALKLDEIKAFKENYSTKLSFFVFFVSILGVWKYLNSVETTLDELYSFLSIIPVILVERNVVLVYQLKDFKLSEK